MRHYKPVNDLSEILQSLVFQAGKMRERAIAPISGFKVGCAGITTEGEIFSGCNMDSHALNPTIHGEVSVIAQAVAAGSKGIKSIAIVTSDKTGGFPCGMCRQLLYEYSPHVQVYVITSDLKQYISMGIADLLPEGFRLPLDT